MTAADTRPLAELRAEDAARFGAKSASLGELLAADIPVPPGFALSIGAFAAFVEASAVTAAISRGRSARSKDMAALTAAAERVTEAMRAAPLPEPLRAEIAGRYAELGEIPGVTDPPVAVRSSALGEDGEDATFAGQQETILWVRGLDGLLRAIRDCWASLYSPTAVSYREGLGRDPADAAMGVTVQLMVDAERSGVMFTCNPVTGDRSAVAVNASWGLGLAVVGGEVTPDEHLVSKVTREVLGETIHTKQLECVPGPDGSGTRLVPVPVRRQTVRCLDAAALAALVDVGLRIDRHFGASQDVEWAIARDRGPVAESLFVLQSRPVTGLPEPSRPSRAGSALSLVMDTFGATGSEV